ncbi:MAG: PepSY-associated TM helix domain-containing protein [Draconibacterium sp.]
MKLSNKIRKWLRILHRDLGYLLIGFSLIYAVSGFLLNHMDGKDPAYETTYERLAMNPGMTKMALQEAWKSLPELPPLKRILSADEGFYRVMLDGGVGLYNITTGEVDYEFHRQKKLIYFLNKFHYNKVNGWTPVADFFAFSLIYLALSGLFMIPGRKGMAGRGKWLLAAGIVIPLLFVWLT